MAVDEAKRRLRNVNGERWVCYCPRCRDVHETYMLYTGRSRLPRVFCQSCKHTMEMHPVDYPDAHIVPVEITA